MLEEEAGVMRNAMTTRAPCGAKNILQEKSLRGTQSDEIKTRHLPFWIRVISDYKM